MKISYSWLKTLIDLPEDPNYIGALLTRSGLEVESIEAIEPVRGGLDGLVIGHVLTCEKHPDADKLSKTTVDIGGGIISPIVCGAPNVAAGQKVIVATVGATLYPSEGEPFKIKKAKIRGEASEGMICAEDEIGLGASHDGIMVLDTQLPAGTPAAQYFNLEKDFVFEIGLTPNRADAASHLGVARDLRALLNRVLTLPSVANFAEGTENIIQVRVENSEACPRFGGVVIDGVQIAESPEWLQKRLIAIGLSPINNVVDATNYVMHELGQPLHAFDAAEIKGNQIIVRNAAQGEKFVTLDKQERTLHDFNLMICNAEEPMAIAGVFGGAKSGVKESTTRIFLESAYFSPVSVRKTSQTLGLKTDASFRFERGINPDGNIFALKRAALLIQEIAGGKVVSPITDIYPEAIEPFEFEVKYRHIDRLIGKVLDRDLIHKILHNLDITTQLVSNYGHEGFEESFRVSVPPYRVDVQREADIIEEILRIYGFENVEISEHLSTGFLASFPETDKERLQADISRLLAANGFNEILTNSLTKGSYVELTETFKAEQNVNLENGLSEALGAMRQTLLFSGLETLAYNINRRQKDLKIFEFGRVYWTEEITEKTPAKTVKGKKAYQEEMRLALFVTGDKHPESWQEKSEKTDFFVLAGVVQQILARLGVAAQQQTIQNDIWSYGVEFKLNNRAVATVGLVNQKLAKATEVKQAVFYADFAWEYLLKKYSAKHKFAEVAKFPEVRRDLSLILDKKVSFDEIRKLALRTEKKLLQQINVFDVYEGANIGTDKKSYSVSFTLQDETQTLTDAVIDKTMSRLMEIFEKELGAVIRK